MEWSQWSPCSTTCGPGIRRRVMMCVNLDEGPLDDECQQALQTSQEKQCNLRDCPGTLKRCFYQIGYLIKWDAHGKLGGWGWERCQTVKILKNRMFQFFPPFIY